MRSLKHLALTAAFATSAGTIDISAAQASARGQAVVLCVDRPGMLKRA